MKSIIWGLGFLITCSPALMAAWVAGGGIGAIFRSANYKTEYKSVLFVVVAICSMSLLETIGQFAQNNPHQYNPYLLFALCILFIISLFYALVSFGWALGFTQQKAKNLNPSLIRLAWIVIFSNAVATISLKLGEV